MGRTDSQSGQRLTLRCGACHRPLRIYYKKKNVSAPAKLVVLDGSVHITEKGTTKVHATCKCGATTVFENKTTTPAKQGWRRLK